MKAAEAGHEHVVRLLLSWEVAPARAGSRNGMALVRASKMGHTGVVCLLEQYAA